MDRGGALKGLALIGVAPILGLAVGENVDGGDPAVWRPVPSAGFMLKEAMRQRSRVALAVTANSYT